MMRNGGTQKRWRQAQPVRKLVGGWGRGGRGLEQCAHEIETKQALTTTAMRSCAFFAVNFSVAEVGLA